VKVRNLRLHHSSLFAALLCVAPAMAQSKGDAAPPQDARRIAIPGQGGHALVWQDAGDAHYAISLDGRTLTKQRTTSYEILMRRAEFDPLVSPPDFTGSLLPSGGNVYFVQFWTQTLQEYRDAIAALGGEVYSFVPNHAQLVRMDPTVRDAVAALPFVRWVGAYHTEFRLAGELLAGIGAGTLGTQKYNVGVFQRGLAQKQIVAEAIVSLGGSHEPLGAEGFLLEATLTPEQLAFVASLDQVQWIDVWGAAETDMDVARQIGGANYIQTQGNFTGKGVRAEVMDVGTNATHPEYAPIFEWHGGSGANSHGTSTHGINFAKGLNASARGMVPDAAKGYGATSLGGAPRYTHTAQLVNPALAYQCVYQSNSWGDPQTTQYTSKSQELDDIIFINDIVICQSQSNTGNQSSRPQAWAKNMVSVGATFHQNTLTKADDSWSFGASIGPASDGRIKPDLLHFYDNIFTTTGSTGGSYTSSFGGTSGATPITAGHFGLFFEMWHAGIFGNATGATVFSSRPHSATAKAVMINTASSYPFSGTGHDLTRTHQGWGMPDLMKLYDERNNIYVVDEWDVAGNMQDRTYTGQAMAGATELKVTLVYLDRAAVPPATKHRVNDLTLKVTSPGGTVYWGNVGLLTGNWSTAGGVANDIDTVENVFVQNPQAGTWQVEVQLNEINQDTHLETPELDADYALVIRGLDRNSIVGPPPPCSVDLTTYCTAKSGLACGVPAVTTSGQPDPAQSSGFFIFAGPAGTNKSGLLMYGNTGRNNAPFHGGTLCLNTPIRRTIAVSSGGSFSCDGEFAIDMNAFAAGVLGGNPQSFLTTAGNTIQAQWWGRDTVPTGAFLSDAVEWNVCP
jgi:hypothetical protein